MSAFALNPLSHSTGSVFCWMVIMYNCTPTSVLQITHTYLPQALQTCWDGCIHRQWCLGFYSCWCIHHWPSLPSHLKDQEQVANMHHSSIIINIHKKGTSLSYQCVILCLNMHCLCWHFPLQKPEVGHAMLDNCHHQKLLHIQHIPASSGFQYTQVGTWYSCRIRQYKQYSEVLFILAKSSRVYCDW